jgi:hypothetical protein
MRALTIRLLGLAVLVAAAGGCRYVHRLRPAFSWSLDTGLCGATIVVDDHEVLWKERGCENGRPLARRVRRLKPLERAALDAAMSRLPVDRAEITLDEYAPVGVALAAVTRVFEFPCQITPSLLWRAPSGALREWSIATCPPPAAAAASGPDR